MAKASAPHATAGRRATLQDIRDDRVLLVAIACCMLLIAYQLAVTLLQPPWIKPVTDWLRTALAWPQLAIVAWVSVRLVRTRQPDAIAWCCGALGILSYAIARTTWTIADVLVYPHGVPFPSLPDLFFILQYPCFIAAFFLVPKDGRWLPHVRILLDGVLWMSAVTALSWYFVMLPMSLQPSEPAVSKQISMYYQICDLVLFYGLVTALIRRCYTNTHMLVNLLLSVAVASLFVADTWAAVLLLHPPHTYRTGSPPDLFWHTFYVLFPLAALVRVRLAPAEAPSQPRVPPDRLTWSEVLAGMQFVSPSLAVLSAGAVIIVHATVTSRSTASLLLPEVVGIALLLLAALRPALVFLEQEQLRHERESAHARERALRLANERMEAFLAMVAHELKTPLTSLVGNVQLMTRRLDAVLQHDVSAEERARVARLLRMLVERCDHSLQRIGRLVEDVLDDTRIHQGRLLLRLESCDLAGVVADAVADQVTLNPERSIDFIAEAPSAPVLADASRIEQVVTNLVSNALKFSRSDQPVEVRLQLMDGSARVTVHDEGVGIPLEEQPHIWERFYQAKGVDVQNGSQIGFGIGLYICKMIVEGHHGQVGVESAPGQGTTISFTLPVTSPQPEAAAGSAHESATSV